MNYYEESLKLHEELVGKFETISKKPILTKEDLSLLYTPWVAAPCLKIAENKEDVYKYTIKADRKSVV